MFNVLIVDDDKNARFLLRELLESEHYTVSEADGGDTDKIVHHKFDDRLLEMLFKGKRPDGQKAELEDINKAEAMIVEMLGGMKHVSEDVEKAEDVA